ncbi:FAD/NAD(P)-binding domain superfamily [Sergentomyia squamirostris]
MFRRSVKFCDKKQLKGIISGKECYFSSSASNSSVVEVKISAKKRENHFDIVIVGGGMVGTTLASAIGNNNTLCGLSVLLLEASAKFSGFSGGKKYSNRVSALNSSTKNLLNSIGAWDGINGQRFKSIKHMQVWDAISDAFITFTPDHPEDDLAYIVENDLIVDAALKTLDKAENVHIEYNSSIEKCMGKPSPVDFW